MITKGVRDHFHLTFNQTHIKHSGLNRKQPAIMPDAAAILTVGGKNAFMDKLSVDYFVGIFNWRRFTDEKIMADQRTLLADCAANASEPAFGKIVHNYIDLVYSTAGRA